MEDVRRLKTLSAPGVKHARYTATDHFTRVL